MNRERGATLVESAISLSLVLMVMFGIVEAGRYVAIWNGVNTAAREGARYGIAVGLSVDGFPRYTDCSEIENAAVRLSGVAELTPADVTVTYDDGAGSTIHDCASGDPAETDITDGDRVVVSVSRGFNFITPLAGPIFGASTITATDSRTVFKEASP